MMDVLQQILAFIVTLGILVSFHEYGHFWVARRCGVKVLRFSVGFGSPLFSWRDRQGTEFAVAAIPLGGYVKMLDEREGEVPSAELHRAFNNQTVGKRMAIVLAGPIANFLLAIAVYWLVFVLGVSALAPVIGEVEAESPAYLAGLTPGHEIVAVDGEPTANWQDINLALINRIGATGAINITTRYSADSSEQINQVAVTDWMVDQETPDPMGALGIERYYPPMPNQVRDVVPENPAQLAGVQAGDWIVAVDGQPVGDWFALSDLIESRPKQPLTLTIERDGRRFDLAMVAGSTERGGKTVGIVGIYPPQVEYPPEMQREIRYGPLAAIGQAIDQTGEMISFTLVSIKNIIIGIISVKNLSGPITIAKVAGASADVGLVAYLQFLAYVSISLGLINLFPIPVLDGGHFMYYLIEAIRGKAVSEKTQMLGLRVGLSIIAALMFMALYNDLTRL